MRAALSIIQVLGGELVGAAALMNKADAATLEELNVHWLVAFSELVDVSADDYST